MKVLTGTVLALALATTGCQADNQAPRQEADGGGGGGGPNIYPSPLHAPPHPTLLKGATGGVRQYGGPPMGGMDPSGIGPGNVEAGGGGGGGGLPLGDPKRYPPVQTLSKQDPNAAPINEVQ